MNKKIIITIVTILIFIIMFSFINQEKTEYGLIEITGEELLNTFLDENISITFALYNEKDAQAEDFIKDLKKVSAQARENIYYVNTHFVTTEFEQVIDAAISRQANILSYYVMQDGKMIVDNTYKGFNTMFKELNGKKYDTKIKETSREKKLEYLEEAKKHYKEGKIAYAFNYLSNAWTLPEAKKEYKNNPYYKLIASWEMADADIKSGTMEYTNFHFLKFNSSLYTATKEGKIEGFEKPSIGEYTLHDVLIKDNKVYIKNKKTNKYEPTYDIITIEEYKIVLKKGNTTMEFRYEY